MSFLIDTNVASEAMRREPSADVIGWVASQPARNLHLSTATIAEIEFGIARLADRARKTRLEAWRDGLVRQFGPRMLPLDLKVATAWGQVRAHSFAAGRAMPLMDALLAATAEAHGLTVVTRNVRDFDAWGGPTLNPWR